MSAVIVQIADAVAAAINGATLSQSVAAERLYVPVHELNDLDTVKVSVVPAGLAIEELTRASDLFTYTVDVGIQRKVSPADPSTLANADVDPWVTLTEEIGDLFRGRRVGGFRCTGVANRPVYSPDHLDEKRVFTSVLSLTFTVDRVRP